VAIETFKFKRSQSLKGSSRNRSKMGILKVIIVLFVLIPLLFVFTQPKDRTAFFSYQTAKVYERFSKFPEAKKYYVSAYENSGKEDLRAWVKIAEMCNKTGQYYEAKSITESMIEFGITDELKLAEVYRQNGEANTGLEDYDTALVSFLRSVELNPDHYYALIGAGKTYRLKGDNAKSRQYLESAVEKRQLRAPEAHYELGLTYMAENNNADALEEFDLVMRQMAPRKLRQLAEEKKIDIISNRK